MDFTFAQRLEQIMRERQLSPAQVEKLTGVKRQKIYEYVTGTHQPNGFTIKRIALGLKVSADWLLGIKVSPTWDK